MGGSDSWQWQPINYPIHDRLKSLQRYFGHAQIISIWSPTIGTICGVISIRLLRTLVPLDASGLSQHLSIINNWFGPVLWTHRLMLSKNFTSYNLHRFFVTIFCQKIIRHSSKISDYPPYSSETFNKNILTGISLTKIFVVSNGRSSVRRKW